MTATAWDEGTLSAFFPELPMHYRAQWYAERRAAPVMFGFGAFGQYLYVAPGRTWSSLRCPPSPRRSMPPRS
jgi:hypothetical protein